MKPIIVSYCVGVASSITAYYIINKIIKGKFIISRNISSYLKQLESNLKDMPFIYRDLGGDVINDFVEVEIEKLDHRSLKMINSSNLLITETSEKIRNLKRIIFIGNAGIGKTTFQRHIIISIIRNKRQTPFLHEKELPIPFYVPLKAVDNIKEFPILRYLLDNSRVSYIKMLKLIKKGRIFLFLDGYDEIPFVDTKMGERNYILEELNLIFQDYATEQPVKPVIPNVNEISELNNKQLYSIYKDFSKCRIWLATRREYFEKNPIDIPTASPNSVKAMEVTGIGKNRSALVERIFDKYRKTNKKYKDLLNEEYFLQEIDRSIDYEIKKLSYNPLFLTVMCYIYVNKVIENQDFQVLWSTTFYQLVMECIALLLRDLDEEKARDLPKLHREALLRRRNVYTEEKQDFLVFFAYMLYFEEITLFNIAYLKRKIKDFFFLEYKSDNSEIIIRELDNDSKGKPNFAYQIIFSGIFITVDRKGADILYDFPHRRFREVLASEYIKTPEIYLNVLANMNKNIYSEFLRVFINSPSFKKEELHYDTLKYLLSKARTQNENDAHLVELSKNFFEIKPPTLNWNDIIQEFFIESLNDCDCNFTLSYRILENFTPSETFLDILIDSFKKSIELKNRNIFTLSCMLLEYYNKLVLKELLDSYMEIIPQKYELTSSFYWFYCKINTNKYIDNIEQYLGNKKPFYLFCFIFSLTDIKDYIKLNLYKKLINSINDDRHMELYYFFWKFNNEYFRNYIRKIDSFVNEKLFEIMENNGDLDIPYEKLGDSIYLMKDESIKNIIDILPDIVEDPRTKLVYEKDGTKYKSEPFYLEINRKELSEQLILRVKEHNKKIYTNIEDVKSDFRNSYVRTLIRQIEAKENYKKTTTIMSKKNVDKERLLEDIERIINNAHIDIEITKFLQTQRSIKSIQENFEFPEIFSFFER